MMASLMEVELHPASQPVPAVIFTLIAAASSVFLSPAAWKSVFTLLKA
jgi:hypothetical protein